MGADPAVPRRCAVLGSPIDHSRSPDLHLAAYRALGLHGWTYDRIECPAGHLAATVAALDSAFVGLSVTMPGKVEALEFAAHRTVRAELVGSANTLVRGIDGWSADCTDIDGVRGALNDAGVATLAGQSAVVVGAGGTARPALLALVDLGTEQVTIVARDAGRARSAVNLAEQLGLKPALVDFNTPRLAGLCAAARVVVSTVPPAAITPIVDVLAQVPVLLDVIYHPWPTPLASAVQTAGGLVASGLDMLLNQALEQVRQFTGQPAPRAAMAAAIGLTG